MAMPYATESQVNRVLKRVEQLEKQIYLLGMTPTESVADVLNTMTYANTSNLLTNNVDAIMSSINVSKNDSSFDLYNSLYNKLQNGDKINVQLSDGSILNIGGHYSDESGRWTFDFSMKFSEKGTSALFNKESGYVVKDGELRITSDTGEIIKTAKYGSIIGLYTYKFDLKNVNIVNGAKKFTLDIEGLSITEEGFDHVLVIDPDRSDWTITIRKFTFPDEDAPGVVKVNGQTTTWKDVKALLNV